MRDNDTGSDGIILVLKATLSLIWAYLFLYKFHLTSKTISITGLHPDKSEENIN